MRHYALRRRALRDWNIPARCGGGNETLARAGADLLHLLLRLSYGHAAVREHVTVDFILANIAIGRGILDAHLRPVALQFFGDHHRQRRHAALTHFRALIADQNRIVRVDGDPRVDIIWRIAVAGVPGLRRSGGGIGRAEVCADTDHEATGGSRGGEDEMAAVES